MPTINREFQKPEHSKFNRKKRDNHKKKKSTGNQWAFDNVYNKTEWHKLRKQKLMDCPLCEMCLKEDGVKPALDVHHRIPILDDPDKAFDYNNLMSLCRYHHIEIHRQLREEKKRKELEDIKDTIKI